MLLDDLMAIFGFDFLVRISPSPLSLRKLNDGNPGRFDRDM
jgi:hypothetical protein